MKGKRRSTATEAASRKSVYGSAINPQSRSTKCCTGTCHRSFPFFYATAIEVGAVLLC